MSRPGEPPSLGSLDLSSSADASSSSSSSDDSAEGETITDEDPEQRVGTQIGKYSIKRMLGRGGMGSVYEGEDTVLRRQVAVKFLPKKRLSKPAVVERFVREAQVAGRLNHPNIITIYDVVHDETGCYIVMEVLNSGSAGSRLKTGPYHWIVATRIIADCCAALKIAHGAGIVHRDIKPDNILFSSSGIVKLIDFGLVKLMEEDMHLTRSGAVCGTPLYMSPEQAQKKAIDPRSDIYSLGATYFALLTGWPPYLGLSVVQILLQHVQAPTPNPRELIPEIPEACVRVLMRSMEKKRELRYQTAAEMGSDLERILRRRRGARNESIFVIDRDAPKTPERPIVIPDDSAEFNSELGSLMGSKAGSQVGNQTASKVGSKMGPQPSNLMPNPLLTRPAVGRMGVVELSRPLPDVPDLSRRNFVLFSGIGAAAIAAGGGVLFFQQLNRTRKPGSGSATGATSNAITGNQAAIQVAVLHSLSGPMAVSERPVADASLLAIAEINESGGVLGRRVQPIIIDGHSQVTANSPFAEAAERLVAKDEVAAVFGGFGSAGRKVIRSYFEKYDRLLFYPGQYEGLEESTSIFYTGATPNQFALPAIRYCAQTLSAKRYYLIGTDGFRARATNVIIAEEIKRLGGEVVGEHYDALVESQFGTAVKAIERAHPQIIINMHAGDSSVGFFKALAESTIPAGSIPVVSFLFGENEIAQLGRTNLSGHFVARTRFPPSTNSAMTTTLSQRFAAHYGAHRLVSEDMEAAYYGVHLWAAAVRHAGTPEVNRVRLALKEKEYDLYGVRLRVDPSNQHTWKLFALGKIGADNRIEQIKLSDDPLPPLPFPGPRTRMEWEQFRDELYRTHAEQEAAQQKGAKKK